MRPASHEAEKLYATANAYKFNLLDDMTADNLNFRPIISQIETYTHNPSRVISQYLKLLCENEEYKINDTQTFESMIKIQTPLSPDEEDALSLFINIPVDETIKYISSIEFTMKRTLDKFALKLFSDV